MISVAAELAEMHPQTLRMYEARGLITPKRSPKNTRLYSQADVERLRRIQRMTSEEGLNLAGVETVLELEQRLERMRAEMARMRKRAAQMEAKMTEELERLRKSMGGELVPYGAYEPERMRGARLHPDPDSQRVNRVAARLTAPSGRDPLIRGRPAAAVRRRRCEQPAGHPLDRLEAAAAPGSLVGEDGEREPLSAAVHEQGGLVGDLPAVLLSAGRSPAALEPDRPAVTDRLGNPPALDRRDPREQPLGVGAVRARAGCASSR